MQYIDKSKDEAEGLSIIDNFMQQHWLPEENRYANIGYSELNKKSKEADKSPKESIKDVLYGNQNHYCCYCQRLITTEGDCSIEHIIPESFDRGKEVEYNQYTGYGLPFLTKENIILDHRFEKNQPPYPHDISYHNMVLSCEGIFPNKGLTCQCCNHVRGAKDIYPLFYNARISEMIEYRPNGSINPIADKMSEELFDKLTKDITDHLKLSTERLREIRKLWYLLRSVPINKLKAQNDESSRRILMSTYVEENNLKDMFCKDEYWKTFLQYQWFHNYYLIHYPLNTNL